MERKHVDVVVMSDLHLGTYGCHATEIVNYLKSISPSILVLNGDIIVVTGVLFARDKNPVKVRSVKALEQVTVQQ